MVQQLQLPEQPAVSIMDTTAVGDFLVEEGDSGLAHPYWDVASESGDIAIERIFSKETFNVISSLNLLY